MSDSGEIKGMLFFGFGFCAAHVAPLLAAEGFALTATCRTAEKARQLQADGITPLLLDGQPLSGDALAGIDHILLSAAPDETSDPALPLLKEALASCAAQMRWLGYLSTTGVYGDHQGAWVDEETPAQKIGARGQRRVDAENAWGALADALNLPMHYFRLAGIYGPGRNQLASLKRGTARRIEKPGQVFSRIHVVDIAQILRASMARPHAGRAYNLCDDEAAPPQDVVTYAAQLMGVTPPPVIKFEAADLSPMAQSFYADNKRLKNDRIKQELGVQLAYPNYRDGLKALYEAEAF
ncbi:MAG: SDR family oxidoreductase [Alphaproteobacteria bacterium]|nr:SDR family oxidoreductase [Alphaproteobacteria bacterium]